MKMITNKDSGDNVYQSEFVIQLVSYKQSVRCDEVKFLWVVVPKVSSVPSQISSTGHHYIIGLMFALSHKSQFINYTSISFFLNKFSN